MFSNITLNPDILPNNKLRLLKESFELFRRASNLHDSVNMININNQFDTTKSEKMKLLYQLLIIDLENERDKVIEIAIKKYQDSKRYNK